MHLKKYTPLSHVSSAVDYILDKTTNNQYIKAMQRYPPSHIYIYIYIYIYIHVHVHRMFNLWIMKNITFVFRDFANPERELFQDHIIRSYEYPRWLPGAILHFWVPECLDDPNDVIILFDIMENPMIEVLFDHVAILLDGPKIELNGVAWGHKRGHKRVMGQYLSLGTSQIIKRRILAFQKCSQNFVVKMVHGVPYLLPD